ncbi:MAG: hypothetical protein JWL66_2023 [Sphingomonadales bacterium]|jgi:hypothetical protein|nr:hypothetical protein [Sphingomonadales bacterium]
MIWAVAARNLIDHCFAMPIKESDRTRLDSSSHLDCQFAVIVPRQTSPSADNLLLQDRQNAPGQGKLTGLLT